MSEETPEQTPQQATGHASVDRVLASLDVLDEMSVHDHVAVFEEAHRALRSALDESPDDPETPPDEAAGTSSGTAGSSWGEPAAGLG